MAGMWGSSPFCHELPCYPGRPGIEFTALGALGLLRAKVANVRFLPHPLKGITMPVSTAQVKIYGSLLGYLPSPQNSTYEICGTLVFLCCNSDSV